MDEWTNHNSRKKEQMEIEDRMHEIEKGKLTCSCCGAVRHISADEMRDLIRRRCEDVQQEGVKSIDVFCGKCQETHSAEIFDWSSKHGNFILSAAMPPNDFCKWLFEQYVDQIVGHYHDGCRIANTADVVVFCLDLRDKQAQLIAKAGSGNEQVVDETMEQAKLTAQIPVFCIAFKRQDGIAILKQFGGASVAERLKSKL